MNSKNALIVGASGLVGNELLHLLLDDSQYDRILLITRKPLSVVHPKVTQQMIDFGNIENVIPAFRVNDVYCALGTTIRQAGSQEAFRRVDADYVIGLGRFCEKQEVERFLVVSAMGADNTSRIFYNRVKGEMELALSQMKIPAVSIFRPSLLLGARKEFRFGERVAQLMMGGLQFLFVGSLVKYRPIHVRMVARAMIRESHSLRMGFRLIDSGQMWKNDDV